MLRSSLTWHSWQLADKHEINKERFIKIGRSKAYDDRNEFEQIRLKPHIERTKTTLIDLITALEYDEKSFDGGYWELIGWYRNFRDQ